MAKKQAKKKSQQFIDPQNFVEALVNAPGFAFEEMGTALAQAMNMAKKFKLDFGKPVQKPAPQMTPEQKRMQQLNILRENTIAQTPYTPEAEAYLRSLPLESYGHEPFSSVRNEMTGGQYTPFGFKEQIPASFEEYPLDPTIAINNKFIDPARYGAGGVNTMRHEFIHALDKNINVGEGMAKPKMGATLGDSFKYFSKLKQNEPSQAKWIDSHINHGSPVYASGDDYTTDVESFAYHGQQGPSVMLNKNMAPDFSGIYVPASKNINFSPMYPSPEYMRAFRPFGEGNVYDE